jgi:hypothetical protein
MRRSLIRCPRFVPCGRRCWGSLCWAAGIIWLGLATVGIADEDTHSSAAHSTTDVVTGGELTPQFLGNMSCATASCHGSPRRETILSSAAHFYWDRDKHQFAGAVLRNHRSREMIERLGWQQPAWETRKCLACHAPSALATSKAHDFSTALNEGVGCESCHGPASAWLGPHRSIDWTSSGLWPASRKEQVGFRPTKDLVARIDLCADCHVGNERQAVNHDLIAAGHPRLAFESAAYQAQMPVHWSDERVLQRADASQPPHFTAAEAANWGVGQLISAEHELGILEAAALRPDASWPELAQYDCFGCHHELNSTSFRQQRASWNLRPGEFQWGTWSLGLISEMPTEFTQLTESTPHELGELARSLRPRQPDRESIPAKTAALRQELRSAARRLAAANWTLAELESLRDSLSRQADTLTNQGWDRSAQLYLALAAIEKEAAQLRGEGNRIPPALQSDFQSLRGLLAFPSDGTSVVSQSPSRLERDWASVRERFGRLSAKHRQDGR